MKIYDYGDKELEKILAYDNYEYIKKLELGKKIYEIINKNEIYQESLRSKDKDANELYMKKKCKVVTSKHYHPGKFSCWRKLKLLLIEQ